MKNVLKLFLLSFTFISFGQTTLTPSYYQDTQGHIDVSSDGQATFEMPIALPPSIADVGPKISLTYNSGNPGGIAGVGWDVLGLSSIRRISTRIDLDGFRDGVDFDNNDKLALDGMRLLLKSGSYFMDGAEYITEIHSNTKITQQGNGDSTTFIITEPDGSRKWYKLLGSDKRTFYIEKFEDYNGNKINYEYIVYSDVIYIQNISFSCNNTTNLNCRNKISFEYNLLSRCEIFYDNGVKKEKKYKLKNIKV